MQSNSSDTQPLTLHFAHANGFPAQSYRKLWGYFPAHFNVIARDKFGHDEKYPVNDNWQNQVQEIIHYIEANTDEPVYAVGHSFGGVISFMAACQRPDLFKGLVMIEPPIMAGMLTGVFFRLLKKTPWIDKVVPSGKSRLRKSQWGHDEDVVSYFKPKSLFRHFDEDCISDYVRAATTSDGSGTRLVYQVAVETAIFRNVPHNIHSFNRKLKVPAKLFTAQHTDVCFPAIVRRFLKGHKHLQHSVIPAVGHMFPLEKPEMTAKLISDTILQWENSPPERLI